MKKKISFLLTTLNEYTYLKESIENIFLKINPYELIIIDDNSSDSTSEFIKKLRHPKIKFISRKNNKGLSSAILRGIIESKKIIKK